MLEPSARDGAPAPASTSISFVCQPGRLAAQAALLAASLRDRHPRVQLVAALPDTLPPDVARAFATLEVATAAIVNPLAADYPIGNKVAALAAGQADGLRVFLDSDMLCLRQLDFGCLAGHGLAAKPVDIRTFGDEAVWRLLYARFGLPLPAARVVASVDHRLMVPYFNAGMLATTLAGPLAAVWADVCRAIDGMADINPRRPWLDQIGLPLAAARLGLSLRALGEDFNYPAHIKPLGGTPALVHYHVPEVVAREPLLTARVAHLLARYPEVAAVVDAHPAWAPVLRGIERRSHGGAAAPAARAAPRDRTNRDLIITGIPRSGTSLLCRLLDRFDNVAVVNEPASLFEGLTWSPEPWAVPVLHADLRARIDAGEAIENKLDAAGNLTEDTARQENPGAYRPHLRNSEWVLASKNTLAYMARLEGILRLMPDARVVALVRHPLDTLASWKGTFEHLVQGDPGALPVGGLADPFLPASLQRGLGELAALPTAAVRRAAWWRLLATELLAFKDRIEIVRYEDLVADPRAEATRVLGPLAQIAGQPVGGFAPSAARTERRGNLDEADWQAVGLLCADVAGAFGYDCTRPVRHAGECVEQRHGLVGRPDLWRMKRAFQIDFLRAQGLRAGHRVLDIGCGSLRGGAALIAFLEPGGYSGIDVRESVLAEARRELLREGLLARRPELKLVDNMLELDLQRRFDVVWAFSVLFHLADPILDTCMGMAARHLEPEGVFFANVIIGEGVPGEWQGFPVVPRSLDTYRALALRYGLHTRVVGTLAELGHHSGVPSGDSQSMLAFGRGPEIRLR